MKKLTQLFTVVFLVGILSLSSLKSQAHCEIPCGIYGDSLLVALLYEHFTTIEKSMNQIKELSGQENPDYNQLVRWVNNKEQHALEVQEIVSQYFLHQRVKPTSASDEEAYRKYTKQLELLHNILVFAMKSKQTTDVANVEYMREKLHAFEHIYFENHKH